MKPWTMEDMRQLQELHREGRTAAYIGVKLDRSRNAIIGKMDRLGLKLGKTIIMKPKQKRGPGRLSREQAMSMSKPETTVSFSGLSRGQCHFPFGDPGPEMECCGRPVMEGKPYCEIHYAIAHQETRRERRAAGQEPSRESGQDTPI